MINQSSRNCVLARVRVWVYVCACVCIQSIHCAFVNTCLYVLAYILEKCMLYLNRIYCLHLNDHGILISIIEDPVPYLLDKIIDYS